MSDLEDSREDPSSPLEEDNYPESVTKSMSVSEVCSYLEGKGIPNLYCDVFKG